MTWICKKCGRIQSDSIIYSDEICDDCFEKIKNKKKKGSALNKILSLALVLSFMLCIFSGFGIATAEEINTGSAEELKIMGTYMGYDVISYSPGTEIYNKSLLNYFDSKWNYTDNPHQFMSFCLLDFDSSGNPYIYTLASSGFDLSLRFYGNNLHQLTITCSAFSCEVSYDPTYFFNIYMSWQDKFEFYTFGNSNPDNKTEYTRTIYCNGGEFSGYQGTDKYLLLIPHSDANQATPLFNQLLTGTKDDFQLSYTSPDYSAKFHSFASMNDDVGGLQDILNMIDWIGLGNQYPTVDFSINDAGNNHSYSLRISSNKNYVDVCMSLWEDYKLKRLVETSSSAIALAFTPDIISKFIIASSNGTIDMFGISNSNDKISDAIRYASQLLLLKSIGDLSYVTEYNLSNSYLQFNEGESSSRAYSVCLADYVTITKGLLYRLDIVDNNTGLILDTAFFCNDTTFAKTNTGYGTKVYNYSDYDDLLGDVDDGNGYANNDSYTQGDSLQNDNPNDIVDWDKYNQYDFSNMQNLAATLNSATAGLGGFFMACYNIIPPVFISILLGTFTLVIVLRVLGR